MNNPFLALGNGIQLLHPALNVANSPSPSKVNLDPVFHLCYCIFNVQYFSYIPWHCMKDGFTHHIPFNLKRCLKCWSFHSQFFSSLPQITCRKGKAIAMIRIAFFLALLLHLEFSRCWKRSVARIRCRHPVCH